MAKNSAIEWTDHTFNPWIGCQKVSPGCDNCYAEELMVNRWKKVEWGPGAERKRTSLTNWRQPLKWNREAQAASRRARVFCASLADVFDNAVPNEWRDDLFELIRQTPALDWMLLTKRPQNLEAMLPHDWDLAANWPNIWLGVSVENQEEADRRIPILQQTPARLRFLSCEPLLGPIDLTNHIGPFNHWAPCPISLVIVGGESGYNRRPMNLQWARDLRDQCADAEVPFFMKQIDKVEPIPDNLLIRQMPNWTNH